MTISHNIYSQPNFFVNYDFVNILQEPNIYCIILNSQLADFLQESLEKNNPNCLENFLHKDLYDGLMILRNDKVLLNYYNHFMTQILTQECDADEDWSDMIASINEMILLSLHDGLAEQSFQFATEAILSQC